MRSPEARPGAGRRHAGTVRLLSLAVIAALLELGVAGPALAASPLPSPGIADPRSPGQGPGLVGDPLLAIVVVVAIGTITLLATLAWVRLTAGRGG